ncbi:MAG: lysozyme inhibitor LprI family protein [Pelagimonas sp.]|uniref:lysozyme inhibitor LprI family protein n=1 Tax=Pelagimonas sp. TaxID=2073170 RepID=UPI003D6AB46E
MRYLTFIFTMLASPVIAQDLTYSDYATDACLQSDRPFLDCVGLSALQCMQDTPGGFSTYGESGCLDAELQFWDRLLNVNYKQRMAVSKQNDAANEGFGPSQAQALKQMQRAWIPFRDAKCDFERSQWGGGTGGGPATLNCLMYATAEQAVLLGESWGD